MSSAGEYVAVLTADGMDLYDESMDLYASLKTTPGRQRCRPARTGR